eukprot:scaffold28_cov312-Pinguiococcus_pyrenoidosus.AAC.12
MAPHAPHLGAYAHQKPLAHTIDLARGPTFEPVKIFVGQVGVFSRRKAPRRRSEEEESAVERSTLRAFPFKSQPLPR